MKKKKKTYKDVLLEIATEHTKKNDPDKIKEIREKFKKLRPTGKKK
jgi:hypothetical protein